MRHRVLLLVLALALGAACTKNHETPEAQRTTAPERCEVDAPTPTPSPTGAGSMETPEPPITLTTKATGFFFDLGNNRDDQFRTIDVEASKSLASDQQLCVTTVGDLLTTDAHGALDRSSMTVDAAVDPRNPRLIQVTVTLTPNRDPKLGQFRSGSYSGTIRLAGIGLEKVDIPVGITLRSGSQIWGPFLAFLTILLGLGVGSLARWRSKQGQLASEGHSTAKAEAAEKRKSAKPAVGKPARLRQFWTSFTNWWRLTGARWVLGAATALGIAGIGWSTQFLDNLTFGTGGFSDWSALALWGFAAGYAGKTIADYGPSD